MSDRFEKSLPERLVGLREAGADDCDALARWICAGRQEGWFRAGSAVTGRDLLEFQEETRRAGWTYRAMIVRDGDADIGYLDWKLRGTTGEILGIYLEQGRRARRLGRHLFRWVAAALREQGCATILVEAYEQNEASKRALGAAGFTRVPRRDRMEEGRRSLVFRKRLSPFERFLPMDEAYRDLSGENLYLHHVALAEALAEVYARSSGVELVLGLGSLGRGFADLWSDLDLAVLGRGPSLRRIRGGERYHAGVAVDVFPVDLEACPPEEWDEGRRQAFEEGIVLWRRADALVGSLRRSLKPSRKELREAVTETLLELGWLGFGPRSWSGRRQHGYLWGLPPDLWARRGDLASAHATVDHALDMALHLLFLVNGRHAPDRKWRRFLTRSLAWVPPGLTDALAAEATSPRDRAGLDIRIDAVLKIVEGLVERLEEQDALAADLYSPFLKVAPYYSGKG